MSARYFVIAALALLCEAAGCGARAAETARNPWYEARTARFQVWTDGEPEAARSLVADLERFHEVIMAKTTAEERDAAPPLRIFLAKDRRSFASLTGARFNVLGQLISSARGNYAIMNSASIDQHPELQLTPRAILFHEYTHYIMAASNARVPSWYNEGFAEYMAATEFRQDGSYTLGCPPRFRTAWARSREWTFIGNILNAQNIATMRRQGRSCDTYAQSWYVVHYLNAEPARQRHLTQYLRLWADGAPPADALKQAFGHDASQLDAVLRAYSQQKSFACVAIEPASALRAPQVELRPLDPADAHLHIGDLLLATAGPTAAAFELLERAAKLRPDHAPTLLALARAHWLKAELGQGELEAELTSADRYLKQANARASGLAEAALLEGHLQRRRASHLAQQQQPVAEPLLAARGAYRRAIRSDETLVEAYFGLGATYLIEDNGSQEAIVALEAAAYLAPLGTEIALSLGQLHNQRKNALQALPAFEYVLRWTQNDAQREAAQNAIEQLRADAASPPPQTSEASPAPDAPTPPVKN
jgi:tetratricopeptide (TPR) repeat protein